MRKKFIILITTAFLISVIAISVFIIIDKVDIDKASAYFSDFCFETEFSEDNKPLSFENFNSLSEIEKKAYIAVFNNIEKHPKYIKVPSLTSEEFNNVFFAVKNDNPDILCFSETCDMISFYSTSFFEMHYDNEVSECKRMSDELNKVVDDIIDSVPSGNDFEKELYIHDYIISVCDYSDNKNSSNAYGCLVENEAVCSGYSRAAMLLLSKVNIDSVLVTGTGITPTGDSISHMWNVVWINNEPYHLDVTWNDPISDSDYLKSHLYFNLTTEQISIDHKDMSVNITCVATECNYFHVNDLLYDAYDSETVADICKKLEANINQGDYFVEIEFSKRELYNAAVADLINRNTSQSGIYSIIDYLSEKFDGVIDFSHVSFSKDESKNYIRIIFDSH